MDQMVDLGLRRRLVDLRSKGLDQVEIELGRSSMNSRAENPNQGDARATRRRVSWIKGPKT